MILVNRWVLVTQLLRLPWSIRWLDLRSALALLFPALVTLSTRIARLLPFLKYLRFSREIDWNNFSHTDSSSAAVSNVCPAEAVLRRWVIFLLLLVPCFPSFSLWYASWAFRKFTAALPGAFGGETNFRYFWWIFMRIFLHSLSKMRNTLLFLIYFSSSSSDQHFNNTFSFALLPWRGKLRGESTVSHKLDFLSLDGGVQFRFPSGRLCLPLIAYYNLYITRLQLSTFHLLAYFLVRQAATTKTKTAIAETRCTIRWPLNSRRCQCKRTREL